MRAAAAIAFAFLLASYGAAALEAAVAVDFETFPGADGLLGTADDIPAPVCPLDVCGPLGAQYASIGITFRSGTLFQGGFFPGSAPTNHFISSSPPDATLSRLVTGISITSYSYWTATLYALDENDNVIASDTLTNPHAGAALFLGTMRVVTDRPIRRFTVLPAGCQIGGGTCDPILNLDNLILTAPAGPPSRDVPALTGFGLFALAALVGAVGAASFRRQRD